MTEREWLKCTDLHKSLDFLCTKASDRKLLLFAVSCCHRIDDLIVDLRGSLALSTAEKYADEQCSKDELYSQALIAREMSVNTPTTLFDDNGREYDNPACAVACAVESVVNLVINPASQGTYRKSQTWNAAFHASDAIGLTVYGRTHSETDADAACRKERLIQLMLLHDIFGNPFRPVSINPAWLGWNDATAVKLANAIYDEKTFDRLPILADALEDAGCDNADILNHCRSEGPHVRGCWVVDALLGKE
jgi:hypothetical protein